MLNVAVRGGEDFGGGIILGIIRLSCYSYIHPKQDPYSPSPSADRGRYVMTRDTCLTTETCIYSC